MWRDRCARAGVERATRWCSMMRCALGGIREPSCLLFRDRGVHARGPRLSPRYGLVRYMPSLLPVRSRTFFQLYRQTHYVPVSLIEFARRVQCYYLALDAMLLL